MKKFYEKIMVVGIVTLIALSFFGFLGAMIFSGNDDYARLTDLEYRAEVVDEYGSNGKVVITERLTFDIHAADSDNLFWELWRVLPEEYVDGVKVDYKVNYVTQIMDDGTKLPLGESPQLYWFDFDYIDVEGGLGPNKWYHSPGPYDDYYYFESLMIYVDGLYREKVTYEIQYEMNNAALRYNDASELYLALFSGPDTKHLKSLKGEILIPSSKMPSAGNYDAYTYGTNSHTFDFTESNTSNPGFHTFAFNLDASQLKFKPYNEYVEFALISKGEDAHKFTEYASINDYYNSNMLDSINKSQRDYEKLKTEAPLRKTRTFQVLLTLSGVVMAGAGYYLVKFKRRYTFYTPAQEIEFFRDIPSDLDTNFARRLVFSKHKRHVDDSGEGYSAVLMSLTYKKYIDLVRIDQTKGWDKNNIKIVIVDTQSEDTMLLTEIETRYMDLIARHAKGLEIPIEMFEKKISRDYQYTDSFLANVKSSLDRIGMNQNYFQIRDYNKPRNSARNTAIVFIVIGIFIAIFGNVAIYGSRLDWAYGGFFLLGGSFILSAIIILVRTKKYILLTQFGEDEYQKWYGLYHFLNSETLMNERGVLDIVIWEKYLIYATAFGISEKVIKALKVRVPESALAGSTILYNPVYRSTRFYRSSSSSFHTATKSASFTHRSGGHGGFGGGGRGGGGGGGGH